MIKQRLKSIADRQFGYFTTQQALTGGYAKSLYDYHVRQGNWLKIDRALFRLTGYPDTKESEFVRWSLWASKRHGGKKVVVSHDSALHYYGLIDKQPNNVHLTVPIISQPRKEKNGCIFHHSNVIDENCCHMQGFLITTPYKTLLEMKPELILNRTWRETIILAQQKELIGEHETIALMKTRTQTNVVKVTEGGKLMKNLPIPAFDNVQIFSGAALKQKHPEFNRANRPRVFGGRSAFTLVELLVVISIITILASFMMPALRKASMMARSSGCVNNLRQIGMAEQMYISDNAGIFATVVANTGLSWKLPYIEGHSYAYTGGGYIPNNKVLYCTECPTNKLGQDNTIYGGLMPCVSILSKYTMTYSVIGYSATFYFLPIAGFKSPSSTVLAGDAVVWWGSYKGPYSRLYKDGVGFAHMERSSGMVCADGHALQASIGHLSRQDVITAHFSFSTNMNRIPFAAGYVSDTGDRIY